VGGGASGEVIVSDGAQAGDPNPRPWGRRGNGVGVLVLDPGTGADLPGTWSTIARSVQVLWLWLSAAEDPLVHARATFERQADAGLFVYVITRSALAQTAMLVAAHRPEVVGAVLLVEEEGTRLGRDQLRDVLAAHHVPVHSIRLGAGPNRRLHPLCRREVMDTVRKDLVELGAPAST
jgi:hypothetical protein